MTHHVLLPRAHQQNVRMIEGGRSPLNTRVCSIPIKIYQKYVTLYHTADTWLITTSSGTSLRASQLVQPAVAGLGTLLT